MKRIWPVFAAMLFLAVFSSLRPSAEEFDAYLIRFDTYVYSGGYFDAYAGCGMTDDSQVTYQWCGKYGRDGTFVDLDDNERYSGTHTSHFRFLTADGFAYGTDWEELRFACRVTYKGKSLYTDDLWMHIGSSSELTADLKRYPVTISSFYKNGGASNDGRYEAEAGERFTLTKTMSAMDANFSRNLTNSEMEVKMFVTVTENGKTTAYDNGYTPYRVGKGAVSAKADLYLVVNGVKERLLDSKTIVIDTFTADPVGSAKAKVSASLLREMYPESAKVDPEKAVFQKGQWLSLLKQKGSWWLVSINGFVGYVPATSLDISKTVEEISLTIPEPSDGANPSFSPVIAMGACSLYPTEPVTWQRLDLSGQPYIYASDRFLAGKQYRLVIWLKVLPGYRYPLKNGNPNVTVYVNGRAATVRTAYEQDPEEVLELTVDYKNHVHDPKKVAQVNPTCVKAGKLTYYHCDCGLDFEDNLGQVRITDDSWGIIPAAGHFESPWMSNGTEHYKVCQRRECNAEIPGSRGRHHGGTATCYSAAVCSDCGLEYGSLASHVPGPAATATTPQVCALCGTILKPALGMPPETTKAPTKEEDPSSEPTSEEASETEESSETEGPSEPEETADGSESAAEPVESLTEQAESGNEPAPGESAGEPTAVEASEGGAEVSETQDQTILGLPLPWFLVLILGALVLVLAAILIAIGLRRKKKQEKQEK